MKKDWTLIIVLSVIALILIIFKIPIVIGTIQKVMTRGYRNNNPGNIRLTFDSNGNKMLIYEGEINGSDKSFRTFKTIEYGYRALFALLSHYVRSEGLVTLRQIINTYAPSNENDTSAYLSTVSSMTEKQSDEPIDFTDNEFIQRLVASISYVENGIDADMNEINGGLNLFLA